MVCVESRPPFCESGPGALDCRAKFSARRARISSRFAKSAAICRFSLNMSSIHSRAFLACASRPTAAHVLHTTDKPFSSLAAVFSTWPGRFRIILANRYVETRDPKVAPANTAPAACKTLFSLVCMKNHAGKNSRNASAKRHAKKPMARSGRSRKLWANFRSLSIERSAFFAVLQPKDRDDLRNQIAANLKNHRPTYFARRYAPHPPVISATIVASLDSTSHGSSFHQVRTSPTFCLLPVFRTSLPGSASFSRAGSLR